MTQLTVNPLPRKLAGDFVAQVDSQFVEQHDLERGDYLKLESPDGEAFVTLYDDGAPDGSIRIDGLTRHALGASPGHDVSVTNADAELATSVTVGVPDDVSTSGDLSALVRDALVGRPVWRSQTVTVEAAGDFGGTPVVIEEVDAPSDAALVAATTSINTTRRAESVDTSVHYDEIGGLDEELRTLREMVEFPFNRPDVFDEMGIDPPQGILLHGSPGTGKTLMAKAVANETDAHFQSISAPEIMSKFYGESEARLRSAFEQAAENSPAVIFIDEIDAIAPDRDEADDTEQRVVAQLLSLMDGLEERDNVVVIAATNRLDALDEALRRPGRFDREVEIGVPDEHDRASILNVHARHTPFADDVDVTALAEETHGFVGADLENIVREASMSAIRRLQDTDVTLADLEVTQDDLLTARRNVEPSAMREFFVEVPDTSWDDVGGLAETTQSIRESVEWGMEHGDLLDEFAVDPPSGILLYGPPGTGKTLMAKAAANESDANFISVKGPELLDKYVGESEGAVRDIFAKARENSPSIVFFDELDAIASKRGASGNDSGVGERVVSQLLTELDGLESLDEVTVIATTNRPSLLDSALLRAGRLEKQIHVPVPDETARRTIFEIHTREMPLDDRVQLDDLARRTENFVGADIEALCRAASMEAVRERVDGTSETATVTPRHFEAALDDVTASVTDEMREAFDEIERDLERTETGQSDDLDGRGFV